jgi:RNA polymerase sigma-70 factor (ECF subfamily)
MQAEPSTNDAYQDLLDKFFSGDGGSLGTLWEGYLKTKLYSIALNYLKNPDDAKDVVQEVFIKLLKNPQKIHKHVLNSFEAFAVIITKNACRDVLRKRKETTLVDETLIDKTAGQAARQQGIQEELDVLKNTLNEQEWRIFTIKTIDELTFQAIADRLNIPMRTAHHQYQNILKKIDQHTALRAYWEDIGREEKYEKRTGRRHLE